MEIKTGDEIKSDIESEVGNYSHLQTTQYKEFVAVDDLNKEIEEIEDVVKNHLKYYCEDYQFGYFDAINRLKLVIKHYSDKTEKVNNKKEVK